MDHANDISCFLHDFSHARFICSYFVFNGQMEYPRNHFQLV